jgi:Cu+-exporting ATPase
LKQSDLGVTVTEDLTNFTPASDAIIRASALPQFASFIAFAFTAKRIIIAAFVISFLYNAVGIGVAMAGLLTPLFAAILMPLSSISVVVFATISTNIMARIKGLY